jgi:hypothetical protein
LSKRLGRGRASKTKNCQIWTAIVAQPGHVGHFGFQNIFSKFLFYFIQSKKNSKFLENIEKGGPFFILKMFACFQMFDVMLP